MGSFVIAYDIRSPKRLQRVHRFLKGLALPIQYSVFFFNGSEAELHCCMTDLASMINPKEDDIRCYPLPTSGLQICLGKASLPEDIYYSGQPNSEVSTLNKAQNH